MFPKIRWGSTQRCEDLFATVPDMPPAREQLSRPFLPTVIKVMTDGRTPCPHCRRAAVDFLYRIDDAHGAVGRGYFCIYCLAALVDAVILATGIHIYGGTK
jgi:hypothetical protein